MDGREVFVGDFIVAYVFEVDDVEPVFDGLQGDEDEFVTGSFEFDHHAVFSLFLSVLDVAVETEFKFGDVAINQILESG